MIENATAWRRHRLYGDRVLFQDRVDGGKRACAVAQYNELRHAVRPITAWEE